MVTLTDVASGVPLARSGFVPCTQPVSFSASGPTPVVAGHYYIAAIEGYDQKVGDAGIPVDSAGNAVAPHWFSKCGEFVPSPDASDGGGEDASDAPSSSNPLTLPVQAKDQAEVFLRGCTPFAPPLMSDGSIETGSPAPDVSVESGSAVDATLDASPAFDGATLDVSEASPAADDAAQETNDAAVGTDDATPDTNTGLDSMSPGQDP
jgi:hypothetical protein